ncbi:uncharacterized protein N7459_002832 [Penicillium hispanicum]|uniref:uncharacterized protein n=1 Tax=Penicillium hispanicum TaxID=1080232 RepID=UPI002540C0D4|nr:uncharacterized protein N7459_002832 [Penicillium hispanicum]KAJ5587067.1 hypothetical protein N7459_002832 [Penicillium hispanicum]
MAANDLMDIATACSARGHLSVVGVVVDKLDIYRTRGSSACITFTIKDTSFDTPSWQGGLKVKYFNDNESLLPNVHINDVVLLRNIRVSMFQGKPTGVASQHDKVPWAIFRHEPDASVSPSITTGPAPFSPKPYEKRPALRLLDNVAVEEQFRPQPTRQVPVSQQPSQVVQASAPTSKPGALPFSLLKDIQIGRLNQLLGQVVKVNDFDYEKCLVYITDYTTNESFMNIQKEDDESGTEGDSFGYVTRKKKNWPGPWGQLTLQVTLWEPHAGFAREHVKAGDLVLITYARIKAGRGDGVEAAIHEDRRYPDKIHIRVVSAEYDDRARELMERRKAYWKIHGEPKQELKRNDRQKTNEKKRKEIRPEEGQTTLPAPVSRIKPNEMGNMLTSNTTVKSRFYDVPVRSLESILSGETHINTSPDGVTYQLPFQNVCYRPLLRVVDFFPPHLEDFAVQVPNKSIIEHADGMDNERNQHMIWEWRFCLLVEGVEPLLPNEPRRQMKLYVWGAEGEHLLNSEPVDLRRYPHQLTGLREKLFILWGDLEEKKREAGSALDYHPQAPVKSLPFTCLIKEYGVPCSHIQDPDAMPIEDDPCNQSGCFGWERQFAMFGTTIHD